MSAGALPEPDSEELFALLGPSVSRTLYGWLYRRQSNPPTMAEVRLFAADVLGVPQEHIDRRLRELRRHFKISAAPQTSGAPSYQLEGWAATAAASGAAISLRLRAEVLAPQRCAQCGRTPIEHGVELVVDHKVPQSWGGSNDRDNLQPLCTDCNAGKRDYFASHDADADAIRASINYEEPQKRIGELLKAFDGNWVRTDLLSIVASAKEYQEDWQRRLRDLRFFDWVIESRKSYSEGARVWTYYRVVHHTPWPENIPAAIAAEAKRRRRAKSSAD